LLESVRTRRLVRSATPSGITASYMRRFRVSFCTFVLVASTSKASKS
jgi:hypothetical protein